jgi:hypothetical protein
VQTRTCGTPTYLKGCARAGNSGAPFVFALPPFSTDTGRFLADGQTLLAGKNPYSSPPPVVIEYAHLRSFYPPLQEAFFAVVAFIHPSAFALKLCGGLAELAFVLWFLYRKRRRPLSRWLVAFLLLIH